MNKWISRLLPPRRVRIELKLTGESDEVLDTLLSSGPESPVWRGMDECARRLMQRWEDEATGSLEEKGLAIVRNQALMELRTDMLSVYYRCQKAIESFKTT
jgi:hypothetical protein